MTSKWRSRLAFWIVWLPVLIYAVIVSRQFFQTVGSAVFLSTDDGVANISYALATEGRYGFMSSPLLTGMARHDGLFSYGPFYFYLGAGLIWMFGYSIVLLRSIHLAVILAITFAGGVWFRGRAAGALGALAGTGLLMAFERAHWPMVRPDSLVSLFAVILVICGGLAIRTRSARYWFGTGLAASCGAFTHLSAWALVPAALLILAIGYLADSQDEDRKWRRPAGVWQPIAGLAAGGLLGASAFYASFGFRFSDQMAFLDYYQRYTGSMADMAPSGSFRELITRHFEAAYWYLPYPMAYLVWATLTVACLAVLGLIVSTTAGQRRPSLALLAPPTIVWVMYLGSLGSYNNFHAGYAVLNHVMWLWTGAALIAVGLDWLGRWPTWQSVAAATTWAVSLSLGIGMLTVLAQRTNYRALAAAANTPIDQYLDHVLDVLPARARAWGTVEFGVEHPGRIQLVQFWDAIAVLEHVPAESRIALAPDYLVWGSGENGLNAQATFAVNGKPETTPADRVGVASWRLFLAFADVRYRLVSLTSGTPYGVTRVYAWARGAPVLDRPIVHAYDPKERQWNTALAPAVSVAMAAEPPAEYRPAGATATTALQTLRGELAPGRYLLTVSLMPGMKPEAAATIIASGSRELDARVIQPATGHDIAPWLVDEPVVHLLYEHAGGPFYLSQFGSGAAAIAGVQASAVLSLTNYNDQRRAVAPDHALPARSWIAAFPEIALTLAPANAAALVLGNTTLYGYQAYGPRIPVQPGQRMRLRVPIAVTAGRGCLGVLDESEHRWLLAPDQLLPEYEFAINDSRTVKPVLADCSGSPAAVSQMRATIGDGTYALWSDHGEFYVDQVMQEFANVKPRQP